MNTEHRGIADQILKDVKEIEDLMSEIQFSNTFRSFSNLANNFKAVYDAAEFVVKKVEETSKILKMQSGDKLDIAAEVLDKLFTFNYFVEFFDRQIFRMLINFMVEFLNDKFGKHWFEAEEKRGLAMPDDKKKKPAKKKS